MLNMSIKEFGYQLYDESTFHVWRVANEYEINHRYKIFYLKIRESYCPNHKGMFSVQVKEIDIRNNEETVLEFGGIVQSVLNKSEEAAFEDGINLIKERLENLNESYEA